MKQSEFFSMLLVAIMVPSLCLASRITLEMAASSSFSNDTVFVIVNITNKGDEQAHSLQIEASLGTNIVMSETKEIITTNETCHFTLNVGSAPQLPGIYRIAIKAHYEDINGYPATALITAPLITGDMENMAGSVVAKLSPAKIINSGKMIFHISTTSKKTLNTVITLVCPKELSFSPMQSNISLKPGTTNIIDISINNISAIEGSSYPITAIVDYQDSSVHRSTTASAIVAIVEPFPSILQNKTVWIIVITALFGIFILMQFVKKLPGNDVNNTFDTPTSTTETIIDYTCTVIILIIIMGFIFYYIPPKYLFMNTTTTGGDTPAHNYLASHLKEQLFHHGRIVSWANGWWCGFPMFQYYFFLPYLVIALLSVLIPFNIAFKLVSVIGILSLPICSYISGRMMRLPKPVPIFLAIASVPFLFTKAHTMWGVNIYSTFAGMISNSISFPLMLLFIASSWRDADDGQFRIRTTILLTLLIASHFFTSVMAGLCIVIVPFLKPRAGTRKALFLLGGESLLAFLLMAWWIIPLIAKTQFSVGFGTNWEIALLQTIPEQWYIPIAIMVVIYLVSVFRQGLGPLILFGWMFSCSILLFFLGYSHIAQVFVNVRLWPFVFYALLAICASGTGILIGKFRYKGIASVATLLTILTFSIDAPGNVRHWARWNYEGTERKVKWPALKKLIEPIKGTPGRLSNDLHEYNNSFGSSRAFELIPHLIQKPILEGGILNSAAGSMFSYYVQGETSMSCAGFPNIVNPTSFNLDNGTKHLKLFNVKHFVAKWSKLKKELSISKDWRLISESAGWQLYELLINDGRYVCVLTNMPAGVCLDSRNKDNWKKAGLEWIYTIQLIDQPFVLLRNGETICSHIQNILSEKDFLRYCRDAREGKIIIHTPDSIAAHDIDVTEQEISDNIIKFRTNGIGLPHLIKCSYFPNWKVKGAKKIFMVTPCFMLVYPDKNDVELYYGYTLSDNIGRIFSILGLFITIVIIFRKFRNFSPAQKNR
ncbi:MAG: hypothetical protein PHR77_11615 [Kiritimatiellae bacterium]|nr:hypothetical protein [Kiritimatiellia bacterium]MDD5520919.1 hypothetical protein [Kiritimatiellia bacterium]